MFAKIKKNIILSLSLASILYLVLAIYADFDSVIDSFKKFHWILFPILLFLSYLNYFTRFLKWHYYLNKIKVKISFYDSYSIFMSGLVMSVTPGKMGELLKSYFVKKITNEPISKTAPVILVERITDFLSLLIIAIVGVYVFNYGIVLIITVSIFFVFLVIIINSKKLATYIIIKLGKIKFLSKFTENILQSYESCYILLKPKPLISMTLLSLVSWSFECFGFYLILKNFDLEVNLLWPSFVYAFATIAGSITMLPAGLGVTDGSLTYFRESDYYSKTGMLKRYNYNRSSKFLQPLLANTHNYAIWDDHDFGPNDSDGSFERKEDALDLFKLFWSNPTVGIDGLKGITTHFKWVDVDFFLMDNRYHKSANYRITGKKQMLGDKQIEWLINSLKFSKAPFKFIVIGGQVLSSAAVKENYAQFPEELNKLLNLIETEGITGVLFLTGDRHFSELSKLEREKAYPLYDFTISPLTSGPSSDKGVINKNRVDGSYFTVRNFGLFNISGKSGERILTCTIKDSDGSDLWSYKINENELK